MAKVELNSRDLIIKTLENGNKVVQIKGSTAFDASFIQECEQSGVCEFVEREDD